MDPGAGSSDLVSGKLPGEGCGFRLLVFVWQVCHEPIAVRTVAVREDGHDADLPFRIAQGVQSSGRFPLFQELQSAKIGEAAARTRCESHDPAEPEACEVGWPSTDLHDLIGGLFPGERDLLHAIPVADAGDLLLGSKEDADDRDILRMFTETSADTDDGSAGSDP